MRLNDELAKALDALERRRLLNLLSALFPSRAYLALNTTHTMNQIKLSLRAADDPRTIKEESGVPTFASVFSLHNATRKGRRRQSPSPSKPLTNWLRRSSAS